MCVYSMIMDHFDESWRRRLYWHTDPQPLPHPLVTPQEIDEFHRLLDRAREYDKKRGEPDCELDEKKERLRKLAKDLGVTIKFD